MLYSFLNKEVCRSPHEVHCCKCEYYHSCRCFFFYNACHKIIFQVSLIVVVLSRFQGQWLFWWKVCPVFFSTSFASGPSAMQNLLCELLPGNNLHRRYDALPVFAEFLPKHLPSSRCWQNLLSI